LREDAISAALLAWYDRAARVLPWRIPPLARAAGARPDPYRVWLSEVMLQQTTVAAVKPYFIRFTTLWPDVAALAQAEDAAVMAEWAGLGYYARARNLLACARQVARAHGGIFPRDLAGLRALPGIGPYTAAAVAAIAYDLPAVVVDGNVERVMARLHGVETPLPAAKRALYDWALAHTPQHRAGDYAQAVMDLGATICTPRSPGCPACPIAAHCAAHASGEATAYPRKAAKPAKPTRQGLVWVLQRPQDGAYLLEQRAGKGLLGGMLAFPSTGWDGTQSPPPADLEWQDCGTALHTFTHFHLQLQVRYARATCNPNRGSFQPLAVADLPTLMRKAYRLAHNLTSTGPAAGAGD
jgi:A/G-specific adenine glycosylase